MNSIFSIEKLSFLAIFSISSLLCTSCNPTARQNFENYQFEPGILSIKEKIDETTIIAKSDRNPTQQLYRNHTLGISFLKPQGLQIQAVDSTLFLWREADYQRREEFVEATPLSIAIENNPHNLTAREWLSTHSYNLEGGVDQPMVANQQGIRFRWLGMWSYTSVAVPHPTRQNMIIITWDNEMSEYQGFFQDLVATLAFI